MSSILIDHRRLVSRAAILRHHLFGSSFLSYEDGLPHRQMKLLAFTFYWVTLQVKSRGSC